MHGGCERTPGLYIQDHDTLGCRLDFTLLLLLVRCQVLFALLLSLFILGFIVTPEQIVIVLLFDFSCFGCVLGVDGRFDLLGAVGRIGLGRIPREGGKLCTLGQNAVVVEHVLSK